MSGENYIVPPISWAGISNKTEQLRSKFGLSDKPDFPIISFVERILDQRLGLLRLVILDKEEMGNAEGYTDPKGKFIVLRSDVYDGAIEGHPRHRFTVAHELGHWDLHVGVPLARSTSKPNAKVYELSEPQANRYATELLMPSNFFLPNDTEALVMMRHGVSGEAARYRLDELRKKKII